MKIYKVNKHCDIYSELSSVYGCLYIIAFDTDDECALAQTLKGMFGGDNSFYTYGDRGFRIL